MAKPMPRFSLRMLLTLLLSCVIGVADEDVRKDEPSDDDIAAMEVALRDMLPMAKDEPVAFIALRWAKDGSPIDPPKSLLTRLAEIKPRVAPASEARLPMKGERVGTRYRGVEDPQTGKPAKIFYAMVIRRHTADQIELQVGRYGGPLNANGYNAILERRKGKWILSSKRNHWVS